MKRGFTLIELLVVVLIIGILAAIALPQYEKAVMKARFTEGALAVEEIARANDIFKMATGTYTRDINDLDVSMSGEDVLYASTLPAKKGAYFIFAASDASGEQSQKALVQWHNPMWSYSLSISLAGKKYCWLYGKVNAQQEALCRAWADIVYDQRSSN